MNDDLNRFNWIAPVYDWLGRLVFGGALQRSQAHFLGEVPAGADVLILGGGSGTLLRHLGDINPSCRVRYVEASSRMLAMAAKKVPRSFAGHVTFIHGTEASVREGLRFDAIITPFVLDLYPDEQVASLCKVLGERLRPGGRWLATDFVDGGKWWHKVLLWLMYRFFVLTGTIGAKFLPSWEAQLRHGGVLKIADALFFGGFIKSVVYGKEAVEAAEDRMPR